MEDLAAAMEMEDAGVVVNIILNRLNSKKSSTTSSSSRVREGNYMSKTKAALQRESETNKSSRDMRRHSLGEEANSRTGSFKDKSSRTSSSRSRTSKTGNYMSKTKAALQRETEINNSTQEMRKLTIGEQESWMLQAKTRMGSFSKNKKATK